MKWMRAARNANAMNIKYGRYADRNRAEKKKEKIALCDQTHVDMKWASRFYVKAFLVETCKRRQLWNIFQHFFLPFLSTSISIMCVSFCLLHSSAASKCHTNTRAERKKSEAIHFAFNIFQYVIPVGFEFIHRYAQPHSWIRAAWQMNFEGFIRLLMLHIFYAQRTSHAMTHTYT